MSRLKLFLPLILFFSLAGLFLYALNKEDYNPQDLPSALIDKTLPEFSLMTLESDTLLSAKDITGEVILLNIWATWCATCRVEHPYLNRLASQGVRIIGLNYKDDRSMALSLLKQSGNPYAINLYDVDGMLGLNLGVTGAPETYLIDKAGVIRFRQVGVVDTDVWQNKLKPIYDELLPGNGVSLVDKKEP